jgi:hypothetical protein
MRSGEFVDVSQHGEAGMLAALVEDGWPWITLAAVCRDPLLRA